MEGVTEKFKEYNCYKIENVIILYHKQNDDFTTFSCWKKRSFPACLSLNHNWMWPVICDKRNADIYNTLMAVKTTRINHNWAEKVKKSTGNFFLYFVDIRASN